MINKSDKGIRVHSFQTYNVTSYYANYSPGSNSIEMNRLSMTDQAAQVFCARFRDQEQISSAELNRFIVCRTDAAYVNQKDLDNNIILPAVIGHVPGTNEHYKIFYSYNAKQDPTDRDGQTVWDDRYKIPTAAEMHYIGDDLVHVAYYTAGDNVSPSDENNKPLRNPVTGREWPSVMHYSPNDLTPHTVLPASDFQADIYKRTFEAYYDLLDNKVDLSDAIQRLKFIQKADDKPKI